MPYRLIYIGLALVGIAAIVLGILLTPEGQTGEIPPPIESLSPAPDSQVPPQTTLIIDLEVGYEAEIVVDGWPIADSELTEAQATDLAMRRQRVRDRDSGDRTIRGAVSPNATGSALDLMKDRSRSNLDFGKDAPLPSPAARAQQERAAQELRKAKDTIGKAGSGKDNDSGLLKPLLDKMDRLINAVEKTPQERTRPARAA